MIAFVYFIKKSNMDVVCFRINANTGVRSLTQTLTRLMWLIFPRIERELLALIVSEVNEPMPDPTSFTRTQGTPESSPLSESEDEDADRLSKIDLSRNTVFQIDTDYCFCFVKYHM